MCSRTGFGSRAPTTPSCVETLLCFALVLCSPYQTQRWATPSIVRMLLARSNCPSPSSFCVTLHTLHGLNVPLPDRFAVAESALPGRVGVDRYDARAEQHLREKNKKEKKRKEGSVNLRGGDRRRLFIHRVARESTSKQRKQGNG